LSLDLQDGVGCSSLRSDSVVDAEEQEAEVRARRRQNSVAESGRFEPTAIEPWMDLNLGVIRGTVPWLKFVVQVSQAGKAPKALPKTSHNTFPVFIALHLICMVSQVLKVSILVLEVLLVFYSLMVHDSLLMRGRMGFLEERLDYLSTIII